jgi:hypothetical protein
VSIGKIVANVLAAPVLPLPGRWSYLAVDDLVIAATGRRQAESKP